MACVCVCVATDQSDLNSVGLFARCNLEYISLIVLRFLDDILDTIYRRTYTYFQIDCALCVYRFGVVGVVYGLLCAFC